MSTGRPRSFDEAEVLDRSVHLFWAEPYDAISTNRLASELGLAKPSLYNAFGGKAGLYVRAVDHYRSKHLASSSAALTEIVDPRRAISDFLRRSLDLFDHPDCPGGCLIANAIGAGGPSDPRARACARAAAHQTWRTIHRRARDAHEAGLLRPDVTARRFAITVFASLLGMAAMSRLGMSRSDISQVRRSVEGCWADRGESPAV